MGTHPNLDIINGDTRPELREVAPTRNFKYYEIILALCAGIPFLSNLAATKPIQLGPPINIGDWQLSPLPLDAGFLLFPLAYIFDDILTEVYGYAKARRAIWVSAVVTIAGTLYMSMTVGLPYLRNNGYADSVQSSFGIVFGYLPFLVLGSIVAFLCGSFVNAFVVSRMKVKDSGRRMGWRLLLSTIYGELLDTFVFAVFYTILFHLTWSQFFAYIIVGYVWKVAVEATMLLFVTRRVINFIKRKEGIDVFDRGISHDPVPFVTTTIRNLVARIRKQPV